MSTSGASNGPATPGGMSGIQTDPRQAGEGKTEGVDQDKADDKEADEEEKLRVAKALVILQRRESILMPK